MPARSGYNGTLLEYIRDTHIGAVKDATTLQKSWTSLKGLIDIHRFEGVQARFAQQLIDAAVFRDTIINYYTKLAHSSTDDI